MWPFKRGLIDTNNAEIYNFFTIFQIEHSNDFA